MDGSSDTHRNKCAACFRQFNKMEHLVEHMRVSHHSAHEPKCAVCQKHCRSFESLRDHLIGSLPKVECARVFAAQGCTLCLNVFSSSGALRAHRASCQLSPGPNITSRMSRLSMHQGGGGSVVALGCKMVGGGSDGTLDLCARVCLIDEDENVIFHTFVKPGIPVTHYRYETTGIRPEHLRDAMTPKQAQKRVQELLLNGEEAWKVRTNRGRARILVGHGLDHDLQALGLEYPSYLKRDTAEYPPLMKTSKLSNSLKYLTQTYLGYEIQIRGNQSPDEDCVAAQRLYFRMRALTHPRDTGRPPAAAPPGDAQSRNNFPSWRQRELERMSPEGLLQLSTSDYYCWCLDS